MCIAYINAQTLVFCGWGPVEERFVHLWLHYAHVCSCTLVFVVCVEWTLIINIASAVDVTFTVETHCIWCCMLYGLLHHPSPLLPNPSLCCKNGLEDFWVARWHISYSCSQNNSSRSQMDRWRSHHQTFQPQSRGPHQWWMNTRTRQGGLNALQAAGKASWAPHCYHCVCVALHLLCHFAQSNWDWGWVEWASV